MAAAFSITTGTNAIKLDAERRAVAVFTVVNETQRPLRARASVSPFEPALPEWFSIQDEAERLFPLDGAEPFTVKVAVPADAAPGKQAFRLDVVSVERPDVEWAHGPAVGFEIMPPPEKPKPQPPKGYVESLVGALAGGVLGGLATALIGVVVFLLALGQPASAVGGQFYSGCAYQLTYFGFIWTCFTPGPFGWATLLVAILVGVAAMGSIGILFLLVRRSITEPHPWQTAVVFAAIFLIIGIVATVVWGRVFPPPPLPVLFAPPVPVTPPIVQVAVFAVLTAGAAALSALAARAISRYRALKTL